MTREYWTAWYPKAASTGLLLGRALVAPATMVLLHAAPDVLTVDVVDECGGRVAFGQDLPRTDRTPMCRLRKVNGVITREDCWPGEDDIGRVVILPGGEAATLLQWWHADDHKEWRWQVEFHNSIP